MVIFEVLLLACVLLHAHRLLSGASTPAAKRARPRTPRK